MALRYISSRNHETFYSCSYGRALLNTYSQHLTELLGWNLSTEQKDQSELLSLILISKMVLMFWSLMILSSLKIKMMWGKLWTFSLLQKLQRWLWSVWSYFSKTKKRQKEKNSKKGNRNRSDLDVDEEKDKIEVDS